MGVKVYQKGKGKPKQTDYELINNVFVSKIPFPENNYNFISQGIERYLYQSQNEYIKYGEWLAEPRKNVFFDNEKIVIREIVNPRIFATYIKDRAVVKNIAAVIIEKDKNYSLKYLLALLNSNLMTFYINEQSPKSSNKAYPSFNSKLIKNLPIKNITLKEQEPFIQKADLMLELNKKLQELKQNFINELNLEKVSTKLQKFEELDFDDFVKEYAKAKKLKFADKLEERNFKSEWQRLFENDKKEVLEIQNQINITDKEIDQMVYKLYDLAPDEIKIVEGV
ncbi:TaqI-like C-terminal specificity domain-containing protein [Aliarcobacter cryaerophilus]|uniref:TaqI-like C-terminal specificity domain-containing protein n=1 Tax=Aliarcobacter cryaerophilus TaxID=28198 RepID=UPI0035A0C0E3